MLIKDKLKFIAGWLENTTNSEEGKKVLSKKKTPYGEDLYDFYEDKDDFLYEAGAGDNSPFKEILESICGKDYLKKSPLRFNSDDELITESLDDYHIAHGKQYLNQFDILAFSECTTDTGTCSTNEIFVVDYTHRKIYPFVYEQEDEGDEQWLEYDSDEVVEF